MFLKYAARRAFHAAWIFVVLCYAFALVIHGYLEIGAKEQLRADALERVRATRTSMRIADPEESQTADDVNRMVDEVYRASLRENGLDGPLVYRVHRMAVRLVTFDFGTTRGVTTMAGYMGQRSQQVLPIVMESLTLSICLFGGSFALQFVLALLLGLHLAARQRTSRLTMLLGVTVQGVSVAVISTLAVFVFSYCLRFHPTDPWVYRLPSTYGEPFGAWFLDLVQHYWVPFLVLACASFWQTAYIVEKLAWGISSQDYIAALRARGLPERRVKYHHIARAASPALVTTGVQGLFFVLWGSVIVERAFWLPGIGTLFVKALTSNEQFLVAGILVTLTALFLVGLFALDVSYGALDPRIRVGAKAATLR